MLTLLIPRRCIGLPHSVTHCNMPAIPLQQLWQAATHCSPLQHTATHCSYVMYPRLTPSTRLNLLPPKINFCMLKLAKFPPQLGEVCVLPHMPFEQIELPAKLVDYFLWSDKSKINQWSWRDSFNRISNRILNRDSISLFLERTFIENESEIG